MESKKNVYHAKCPKNGQRFLIETETENGMESVTNFVDITDAQAEKIGGGRAWPVLYTSPNLRRCRWCGTREINSCSCQQKQGCPPYGSYRYQCLFCKELVPELGKPGDVHQLRLSVTTPRFDDIGPLLTNMGFQVASFASTSFDCDVLFINCGTPDNIDAAQLREFIRNGGCAYVSDWAVRRLEEAFPDSIGTLTEGKAGAYPATIIDPELNSIVGGTVDVHYDLPRWAVIRWHKGDCLIRGAGNPDVPMMVTFTEGQGRVFYTSFHNHAQASEKEHALLKLMLLRQISSVCNQTIEEIGGELGLNIADLGSLSRR